MTQVDPARPPKEVRDDTLQGMLCVDTSGNPRIPILMEMVGAMSRAVDPQQVLRIFSSRIEELYGPATAGFVGLQPEYPRE